MELISFIVYKKITVIVLRYCVSRLTHLFVELSVVPFRSQLFSFLEIRKQVTKQNYPGGDEPVPSIEKETPKDKATLSMQ